MRQRYPTSVVADLRKEHDAYVASIDGVDVVKAKIIEMSHCQTERQVLESKYSNCNPYPQFLTDDLPDCDPPKSNQVIYTQPHFREAMEGGGAIRVALMHRKQDLNPTIENKEVKAWWCEACESLVEDLDETHL